MRKFTRRDFLRLAAAGLGSSAAGQVLSACGSNPGPAVAPSATAAASPTQAPSNTPIPSATPTPLPPEPSATAEPTSTLEPTATERVIPDMVVARGGEPEDLVRRALEPLGGMGRFVKSGDDVIINPNICTAYHTYEYAATTNPWVVAALVKMALEAGASKVRVLNMPFDGGVVEAYDVSGIGKEVKAAGGEMDYMPGYKFVSTEIPNGVDLKQTEVYDEILKTNVLINVPIAKHHGTTRLSLGMKNFMGLINDRMGIHYNIGQRIADLASLFRPALTVVDAVRILTQNGPTGGSLSWVKKLDTVIASADFVAADSYAATLFELEGSDIGYIEAAAKMGLGISDLTQLRIAEV